MYLGNPDMTNNKKWSLYNEKDPAMGVTLTYTGGQHCSNGERRALQLNFVCSRDSPEKIENQVTHKATLSLHRTSPTLSSIQQPSLCYR